MAEDLMTADDSAAGPWHDGHGGEPPPHAEGNREPPWSREAEQSVLGGLLLDNRALPLVADVLVDKAFYRLDHQLIFAAISAIVARNEPADPVTVFEALRERGDDEECGGLAYLSDLSASVPSAANIRRYAEIVGDRWAERLLIAGADEALSVAWNSRLDIGDRIERMAGVLSRIEQQRKNPGARVPMLRLGELREAASSVTWLVKHVIPSDSVGMLFGASGTFKSFKAIDCALHVAHGLPWMGRRTKRGPVLYIAAEGGTGLWKRIEAWHQQRRLDWHDIEADMVVVPVALDLGVDAWRVVDRAQAYGVTPALVVVDTMSQTYAGDENAASEVAGYLRELGLRFRALWGCSVLLIHHSGHSAHERPRGSSAILPNVDYLFGAFRDDKEMISSLACLKQKDGEPFADAMFGLSVEQLGEDADGDPITSLVARHLGTDEQVQEARAREAQAGRGGRGQKLMDLVDNGMSEGALRKAFYEDVVHGLDNEAKRKAYARARQGAIDAGYIEIVEKIVIDLRAKKARGG